MRQYEDAGSTPRRHFIDDQGTPLISIACLLRQIKTEKAN